MQAFDPDALIDLFEYVERAAPASVVTNDEHKADSGHRADPQHPEITVTRPWRLPPRLDLYALAGSLPDHVAACPEILKPQSSTSVFDSAIFTPSSSSKEPRVALRPSLSQSETLDLLIQGPSTDPRNVCVLDHPGRNSQFKHWTSFQSFDDHPPRRMLLKDELARPCCLPQEPIIIPRSPSPLKKTQSIVTFPQPPYRASASFNGSVFVADLQNAGLLDEQIPNVLKWLGDCFLVIKVADPAQRSLGPSSLSHRIINGSTVSSCDAEIELSGNGFSSIGFELILKFIKNCPRVRLRAIRAEGLGLTSLGCLAEFPCLKELRLRDNDLSGAVLGELVEGFLSVGGKRMRPHSSLWIDIEGNLSTRYS